MSPVLTSLHSSPVDDESLFSPAQTPQPLKLGHGFHRFGPFVDRWHRADDHHTDDHHTDEKLGDEHRADFVGIEQQSVAADAIPLVPAPARGDVDVSVVPDRRAETQAVVLPFRARRSDGPNEFQLQTLRSTDEATQPSARQPAAAFRDIRRAVPDADPPDEAIISPSRQRLGIPQRWRLLIGLTSANILLAAIVYGGFTGIDRLVSEPLVIDGKPVTRLVVRPGATVRTRVSIRNTTATAVTIVSIRSDLGAVSLSTNKSIVIAPKAVVSVPLEVTSPRATALTNGTNAEVLLPFVLVTATDGSADVRYTELSLSTISTR